jgi:hypothetical protein
MLLQFSLDRRKDATLNVMILPSAAVLMNLVSFIYFFSEVPAGVPRMILG